MAEYDGFIYEVVESYRERGIFLNSVINGLVSNSWRMSTAVKKSGETSICLAAGCRHDMLLACDTETTKLNLWVKIPNGEKFRIQVLDLFWNTVSEDNPVGTDDWQEINMEFATIKGIHVLRFANFGGQIWGDEGAVHIDDIRQMK